MIKIFFFAKTHKNGLWLTSKAKQNSVITLSPFLLFIACYFLFPNLIVGFATVISLTLL
jgi:hypothetical protein